MTWSGSARRWAAVLGLATSIVVVGAAPVAGSDQHGPLLGVEAAPVLRDMAGRFLSPARPAADSTPSPGETPTTFDSFASEAATDSPDVATPTTAEKTRSDLRRVDRTTGDPTSSTRDSSSELAPGATTTGSGSVRAAQRSGTAPGTASYDNCAQIWAAIGRPLIRGEPGYAAHLDADGDGVACEDAPSSSTSVDHTTGTDQGDRPSSTGSIADPASSQALTTDPTPSETASETLASSGFPTVRGIGLGLALVASGGSMMAALRSRRFSRPGPIQRP